MEEREGGKDARVSTSPDNTLRLPDRKEGIVPYRIRDDGTYQFIRFTGSRPLWTDTRILEVVRDLFDAKGHELVKEVVTRYEIEGTFKTEAEAKRFVAANRTQKTLDKFSKKPLGLGDPTLTRHKVPRVIKVSPIKGTVKRREVDPVEEKRRRNLIRIPQMENFSAPLIVGRSYTVLDLMNKLVSADPASYMRIEGVEFLRRAHRQEVGQTIQGSREDRKEGVPSILGTYVGIHSLPVLDISGFETEEGHREQASATGEREIFPSIFGERDFTRPLSMEVDQGSSFLGRGSFVTHGIIGSEHPSEPRFVERDHDNDESVMTHPRESERGPRDVIGMDTTFESNASEIPQGTQGLLDIPSEIMIQRESERTSDTSTAEISPSSQEWGLPSDPDTNSQDL